MVRAYLRYESRAVAGVVASPEANCVEMGEGLVAVGGLERVLLWDLRTSTLRAALPPYPDPGADRTYLPDPDLVAPKDAHVTVLARLNTRLAAGYAFSLLYLFLPPPKGNKPLPKRPVLFRQNRISSYLFVDVKNVNFKTVLVRAGTVTEWFVCGT